MFFNESPKIKWVIFNFYLSVVMWFKLIFMKFEEFNKLIDKLSEQEEYEKVDEILDD